MPAIRFVRWRRYGEGLRGLSSPLKLLTLKDLLPTHRFGKGPCAPAGPVRPGDPLANGHWPSVRYQAAHAALPAVAAALLLLALTSAGCGGATAPCPTPPATLDQHRVQSEAAQRDLGGVSAEVEALENQREEALQRIQAASAIEDSLSQSRTRAKKR